MRPRFPAPGPLDIDALVEAAAHGTGPRRSRAAGRLMSILEAEPHRLPELFRQLPGQRWPRPRVVAGITGAPGTGKSTLTDAIIAELRLRYPSRHVGVVAVDPSSPFTGGAVLGDRVRMMRHATDPHVFIRSLATRGHLGGLSLGVRGVLRVMGLMGCDTVIVETVGVGQSEVEVAGVADRVAVVLAPGAGDSIQMLKAGLMEIADLFIVNKADTEGADALHRTLLQALGRIPGGNGTGHSPGVLLTTAHEGAGIGAVVDALVPDGDGIHGDDGDGIHGDDGDGTHGDRDDGRRGARTHDGPDRGFRDDVRDAVLEAARRRAAEELERDPALLDGVLDGTMSVDATVARLFGRQRNP